MPLQAEWFGKGGMGKEGGKALFLPVFIKIKKIGVRKSRELKG